MSYIIAVHVPIAGMSLSPVFVADWPLVLLPVQIAFLELIIDRPARWSLERSRSTPRSWTSPRGLREPMFSRRVLALSFLLGASVHAAVFGIYLWSILSEHPDDVVRSLTFATLVIGNLVSRRRRTVALGRSPAGGQE